MMLITRRQYELPINLDYAMTDATSLHFMQFPLYSLLFLTCNSWLAQPTNNMRWFCQDYVARSRLDLNDISMSK